MPRLGTAPSAVPLAAGALPLPARHRRPSHHLHPPRQHPRAPNLPPHLPAGRGSCRAPGWPCRGRRAGLGVLLPAPARRGCADRQSHPASTQPSPSTQPWRAEVWHSSGADSRGAGQAGSPAPCSSPAFDSAAPAGRPARPGWRGPPRIPYNTDPAPDKLPEGSVPDASERQDPLSATAGVPARCCGALGARGHHHS